MSQKNREENSAIFLLKGVVAISDDKKYKIQNQQTSASKMLRNIDLEISKDHNSKNVSSVARVLQGSFGIKLLAPVGLAGPWRVQNTDSCFFLIKKQI